MPSGEKTPKQIPPAMEANKWKPGQSGNPSGRPRKLPITDRYATVAELPVPDYLLAALKLSEAEKQEIKTYADAVALNQFRAAIKGKTEAAREIADRLEGRARQALEVSGPEGKPIDVTLRILNAAKPEPLRNRVMLTLSYDSALRREELCALETGDIDPAHRVLRIRAETTKNRRERVVPYSEDTGQLFARYLDHRRNLSRARGPLFLSESRRNHARPISIWTWSKIILGLARRCYLPRLTPRTLRHLCLTDLARANWDIGDIAAFAGHCSTQTTMLYVHLSGRDLAAKLARGMSEIHAYRIALMKETLG